MRNGTENDGNGLLLMVIVAVLGFFAIVASFEVRALKQRIEALEQKIGELQSR